MLNLLFLGYCKIIDKMYFCVIKRLLSLRKRFFLFKSGLTKNAICLT